jgi:uncharacterized repeat protein (TIGR03803 family)
MAPMPPREESSARKTPAGPFVWVGSALAVLIISLMLCCEFSDAAPQLQPGTQNNAQMPTRLCSLYPIGANPEPENPSGVLAQGPPSDDSFYGASAGGRFSSQGTIYELYKGGDGEWGVSVRYSFDGKTLGSQPRGGVTLGKDNDLYGTAYGGGTGAAGIVFKIARSASGPPELLHTFVPGKVLPALPYGQQRTKQQTMDAAPGYPTSPPVLGPDGYVYGVTGLAVGGSGALYEISPGKDFKTLHVFNTEDGPTYGQGPVNLTLAADGSFYGVTWQGGAGYGTVFKFDPGQKYNGYGGITTIYKFVNTAKEQDGTQAGGGGVFFATCL